MDAIWKIVLATAGMYVVVIMLMRFSGKKELAQLSIFDFVFILLISEAVQNAMLQGNESFLGGLTAALTLFVTSLLLDYLLFKNKKFYKVMEGSPSLLYYKGKWIKKNMAVSRVRTDTVESAVRQAGFATMAEVKTVILENDGNFSIIPLEKQ